MSFEIFIKNVLKSLNECNVDYVIIGGLAAILYGRPRTTVDVDAIVILNQDEVENFNKIFKENGFELNPDEIAEAFREKSHVSIFLKNSPFRVDVKGVYSRLDENSLRNKRKIELFGESCWIESPEDIIIAKLVYGTQQDLDDARAILIKQEKLDTQYLNEKATQENVIETLNKLIKSVK